MPGASTPAIAPSCFRNCDMSEGRIVCSLCVFLWVYGFIWLASLGSIRCTDRNTSEILSPHHDSMRLAPLQNCLPLHNHRQTTYRLALLLYSDLLCSCWEIRLSFAWRQACFSGFIEIPSLEGFWVVSVLLARLVLSGEA